MYANVVYLFDLNGVLREVQSSSAEEDIVVMEEEEYFSCVIDCLDTGDQMTQQESAETFTNEVRCMIDDNVDLCYRSIFHEEY